MIFLAIGLVIATTLIVGVVIPPITNSMTFAGACLLGAIVAPTDAIAATAVIHQFRLPRRIITILEEESVLNDAVALVAFRFAVDAVLTGHFSLGAALGEFFYSGLGGILFGVLFAKVIGWVWHRMDDAHLEILFSIIIPYSAYLLAEHLYLSGILSAAAVGLYLGWKSPTMLSSNTRIQGRAFWQAHMFALEGIVFLLTGLQLNSVMASLQAYTPEKLLFFAVVLNVLVMVFRMVWTFVFAYVPRFLDPKHRAIDPYPSWKNVFVIGWSGMRGGVSMAAALSIPFLTPLGDACPFRSLIIFLAFSVIIGTLVVQGLTLPWVIRKLNIVDPDCPECDELAARMQAIQAVLQTLHESKLDDLIGLESELLKHLEMKYTRRATYLDRLTPGGTAPDDPMAQLHALEIKLLGQEREVMLQLRNEGVITEETMQKIQYQLDLEELHLQQLSPEVSTPTMAVL